MNKLTRLRGFQDQIGEEAELLSFIERTAREIAYRYNLTEIRIPLVERIELYERSSGETSDVVAKQMYLVKHARGEDSDEVMVLRPEGTPGVVRAYIEAGLDRSQPEQRFFYCGSMLRYERPQKGRFREFHQFGVEVFGRDDAACDAELIVMIDDLRRELGVEFEYHVNSLGCNDCRPAYREAVLEFGRQHFDSLCADCHQRLERNPLRILDCKNDLAVTEEAPKSVDYLCAHCQTHLSMVLELLKCAGVQARLNPHIVRGLDYYVRTTFEVTAHALGAQNAVAAGGRYDGLVAAMGGAPVAGTGFAIGLERLAMVVKDKANVRRKPDVAVIPLGAKTLCQATGLARDLRKDGLCVEEISSDRTLKAKLKRADKIGAHFAVIIGEDELARETVVLRDLTKGTQEEIRLDELKPKLKASHNL